MGCSLYFKCENLQKVGAFKMRGAANAVLQLTKDQLASGVVTHSSGNHAQALAKTAALIGCKAYIVMPDSAPKVKVKAVEEYGAEIIFCPSTLRDREQTMEEVRGKTGATFIHPYDNPHIIAGQATAALELLQSQVNPDVVIAPVGGGGLLSGTALCCHYWSPSPTVLGSEPAGADDAYRSLHSGKLQPSEHPDTIADGLLTSLSDLTFDIIRQYVDDIIRVKDNTIRQAMRLIWERMKLIVEPSGAVPLAAVMEAPQKFDSKKVGIIISGGNVDLDRFSFASEN